MVLTHQVLVQPFDESECAVMQGLPRLVFPTSTDASPAPGGSSPVGAGPHAMNGVGGDSFTRGDQKKLGAVKRLSLSATRISADPCHGL